MKNSTEQKNWSRRAVCGAFVAAGIAPLLPFKTPAMERPMTSPSPFRLAIPESQLADLKSRLRNTRWPVEVAPETPERGILGADMRELADRWATRFDWRKQESQLNQLPQVTFEHDGQTLHAFHVRSRHAQARPLVLLHGWPSSSIEFLKVIAPLVDPEPHGGKAADAFHVIAPGLPGFGLSPPPRRAGWTSANTAAGISALMMALGYERFGIHASDMGADVAGQLDRTSAGKVTGIHLAQDPDSVIAVVSFLGMDPAQNPHLDAAQKQRVAQRIAALSDRNGYIAIQSSRPKTLGYALTDSPAGQLAWIAEKFQAWTNPAKQSLEDAVDIDQFLTHVSLSWFGEAGAASANAIWESFKAMGWSPPSPTPRGVAMFNADSFARALLDPEKKSSHWSEFSEGGHFPAMEVPELLVADLRRFFASLQ
jgi:pimeloyl-ACP methyl ester carboxylesterase